MSLFPFVQTLRRIKPLYACYNAFHFHKLKYQSPLYKKYGLNKSYFSALSSKDFRDDAWDQRPWLDQADSSMLLPQYPQFAKLDPDIQSALLPWSVNGYAVLKSFFSAEEVSTINTKIEKLMGNKRLPVKEGRKMMFAVRYSKALRSVANPGRLTEILDLLLGKPVELFQSVNFLTGSEDTAHADFIHMSTYPYGYLIAVWIALEDIDSQNGPLFLYPGSHRLKYIMNSDYAHGSNRWLLGKSAKKNYATAVKKLLEEHPLPKKEFLASKGDVLIWHANLLHGGCKVMDTQRTRKSMVMHYYGTDVIRYHEITQRPSLSSNHD